MEQQYIITENMGNVTLDICTRNGRPEYYTTEEYHRILKVLQTACKAIKDIKTKKDPEYAAK